MNTCAPDGKAVPAPHVTPVALLLNVTNIIGYENNELHKNTLMNTNSINPK